jgi:hypothetical protein
MAQRMALAPRLVPGTIEHVPDLAQRLRTIDRIECGAMGHTPEQALRHGLATGARTWTALIGDEPHAMFGVVVAPAARNDGVVCGIPWFLGSDVVPRHARLLIAQGPAILADMHRYAGRLCNFVSSDNRQAIRLLEHWGFTVEQELVVTRAVAFRRFIREIK